MNDDPAAQILLASVEAILDDAGPGFSRPPYSWRAPGAARQPRTGAGRCAKSFCLVRGCF